MHGLDYGAYGGRKTNGLTSFTFEGLPQLLQAAPNLLGGPSLSRGTINIVRYKLIAHRKSAKESCLPAIFGLITFKT